MARRSRLETPSVTGRESDSAQGDSLLPGVGGESFCQLRACWGWTEIYHPPGGRANTCCSLDRSYQLRRLRELAAQLQWEQRQSGKDPDSWIKIRCSSECSGRLLAQRLRSQAILQGVTELKSSEGMVLQLDEQIVVKFDDFYTALYSAEDITDDSIDAFLAAVHLSSIPLESAICLDKDITPAEVLMAIQRRKLGKVPGHDGFGAEFYSLRDTPRPSIRTVI
ncbi:hypothetical protein NDU88_000870 [Pleurodeles waltl]|uniref:Uncharacterized protein n=1 Tax=Pleurodeles waltl TaxID=8319 RepID=A0AAV7NE35_PLEWA|nr:hypothetical protein NDU88_000870 [Pleurodeles waltl]